MNFTSLYDNSLTNHPYIIAGIISTLLWMLFSFSLNKKSSKKALISGLIFAVWYSIGWFVWNFTSKNSNGNIYTNSDISNNINRYTIGITATLLWFLYTLLIQKKSFNRSLMSTGLFVIFYIVAEIVYTIINTF